MGGIVLFHGTWDEFVTPVFGGGDEKHDYGKGFYLTEDPDLAKEWAVCRPEDKNGWVHQFELDIEGLKILDFQKMDVLVWLAELMKHRDAADSKRYRMLAKKFIEKYGVDTSEYDVLKGWRANASYFYIAKEFVRDNIDIEILTDLLCLGELGIQYCIKSELAYSRLCEAEDEKAAVYYDEFHPKYNARDAEARMNIICFHNPDEENGYLSNWYLSRFTVEGIAFSSVEQYMMYQKAVCFHDRKKAEEILAAEEPAEIKALGRSVTGYDDDYWSAVRQMVVYQGLSAKFSQDRKLQSRLKATGDALLAECAVKDRIWGIGLSMHDSDRFERAKWKGRNLLGYTLMMVRENLK